jgi:hypothetical protein
MTTTDYNALDTAALVAAADALTAGITPGEWGWDNVGLGVVEPHVGRVDVLCTDENRFIRYDDADAAFIADAPVLVKALVARLRELSANG